MIQILEAVTRQFDDARLLRRDYRLVISWSSMNAITEGCRLDLRVSWINRL
jgi:hypothetical protein